MPRVHPRLGGLEKPVQKFRFRLPSEDQWVRDKNALEAVKMSREQRKNCSREKKDASAQGAEESVCPYLSRTKATIADRRVSFTARPGYPG